MKILRIIGTFLIFSLPAIAQTSTNNAGMMGRVLDLLGRPLKGAQVTLAFDEKRLFQTKTDETGEYVFRFLPSGKAEFKVTETGFRNYETSIYLNPVVLTIRDVGLQVGQIGDAPDLRVRGTVKNNSSMPIENASVTAKGVFNSNVVIFTRTTRTGSFELLIPSYGQYFVYATMPGNKTEVKLLTINKEKIYPVNFRLGRNFKVLSE